MVSDYALPPTEESSSQNGSMELNIEELVLEAYVIVKIKVDAEEGFIMESGSRGLKDAEEDASLRTKDEAYAKAEGAHNGDMGEGAERATLSSSGKRTATEKVRELRRNEHYDSGRRFRDAVARNIQ